MARLLLVDDEPDIREAMTELVHALLPDLQITSAENGLQALDVLEKEKVSVVLTDYKMPGMDGAKLVQEIRKRWPKLPVRMFTAFMDANNVGRGARPGARPQDHPETARYRVPCHATAGSACRIVTHGGDVSVHDNDDGRRGHRQS